MFEVKAKNNPGVGLQMTSPRTFLPGAESNSIKLTPGPQAYDVRFKLTDREKRQNELLSRRYDNWKKDVVNGGFGNSDGNGYCHDKKVHNMDRGDSAEMMNGGNAGVGLKMTSLRTTFGNGNKPSPPYYDVQFKLTNHEKRQNELLSRRYEMRC